MSTPRDIWATTALAQSGVSADTPAAAAVAARRDIMAMTDSAESAVLSPADPGAWPHALRAALACRCARLNACEDLAAHYLERVAAGSPQYRAIADPADDGAGLALAPVIAFMDRVAAAPGEITAEDITMLQQAGICDADIVRLAELNAFIAYQIRLTVGLTLLAEDAP